MNDDKRLSQMEAELKERFREAFDDYLKEMEKKFRIRICLF